MKKDIEEEFDYLKDHLEWLKKDGVIDGYEILDPEDVDLKDVTIYSMSTCKYCHQAKDFLDENGVEYIDIDVGSDEQAYEHMKKISGQQYVPVIDIDGELIIGFDEKKLREALDF